MRRREFIQLFGGAAATWPFEAAAQPGEARKRIGVLIARPEGDVEGRGYVSAFQQGLEDAGLIIGRNVEVDYRWTAGNATVSQASVKELIARRPDILVVHATPTLYAAREAAGAIPIVMVAIADPVAQGFVQSLARPGGNITGFSVEEPAMGAKWVEFLKEIAPGVGHVTAIFNPSSSPFAKMFLPSIEDARRRFSLEFAVSPVANEDDLERAIAAAGQPSAGLMFLPDSFLASRREKVASLVAKHKVPAIYSTTAFVRSGGLIGYGFDRAEMFRRAAGYVERILKGLAAPADLPVQTPVKFELAINQGAARALNIEVPPTLLARADEVIE